MMIVNMIFVDILNTVDITTFGEFVIRDGMKQRMGTPLFPMTDQRSGL